jgi:hypothetical protein
MFLNEVHGLMLSCVGYEPYSESWAGTRTTSPSQPRIGVVSDEVSSPEDVAHEVTDSRRDRFFAFCVSAVPQRVPKFEPDPYWPKQLPNNWMLGEVGGIFVDSHDHIWVNSRLVNRKGRRLDGILPYSTV